ncbi:MAG: hypothetical protein A2017_05550 [Lentisphaerae bacterium GWF2_44_16]|nr:MAG: hypothetical protein A2017_05550 [Lentisphaerae bacterium GWF2_44_16]
MSITYKGARDGGTSLNQNTLSVRRILVFYYTAKETSLDVYAQPQIPASGAAHPAYPALTCSEISIAKENGTVGGTYLVTCTYSADASNGTIDLSGDTAPWDLKPYNFSIQPVDNVVPFTKAYKTGDKQGAPSKPVVSSSGFPLSAQTNEANKMLRFSYNLRYFANSWIDAYYDTINNSYLMVCGYPFLPGKGLLRTLSPKFLRTYDDDGTVKWEYYQVDIEIEICKKGWVQKLADASCWFLEADGEGALKPKRICRLEDKDNVYYGSYGKLTDAHPSLGEPSPVDEPFPLNGSGGIAAYDGETGKFKITYLPFEEKYANSWGGLSLPKNR